MASIDRSAWEIPGMRDACPNVLGERTPKAGDLHWFGEDDAEGFSDFSRIIHEYLAGKSNKTKHDRNK
jgi:hypothetical protein